MIRNFYMSVLALLTPPSLNTGLNLCSCLALTGFAVWFNERVFVSQRQVAKPPVLRSALLVFV